MSKRIKLWPPLYNDDISYNTPYLSRVGFLEYNYLMLYSHMTIFKDFGQLERSRKFIVV